MDESRYVHWTRSYLVELYTHSGVSMYTTTCKTLLTSPDFLSLFQLLRCLWLGAFGSTLTLCLLRLPSGNWESAQRVARGYLSPDELHSFYIRRAHSCEANKEWLDAEKAYVAAGEVDAAVNMYKANKMWLPMLKLVQQHKREQLQQMHLLVAHVSP